MLATNCSEVVFNMKAQPDPDPPLVMKNHLALDIRAEQLMLVIKVVCREHLLSSVKRWSARPVQLQLHNCIFSFGLCICPTPLPEFFYSTSVTLRQALPYLTCEYNWADWSLCLSNIWLISFNNILLVFSSFSCCFVLLLCFYFVYTMIVLYKHYSALIMLYSLSILA